MAIRKANSENINTIISLLNQLGYQETEGFMEGKLQRLINHPDEELVVGMEYEVTAEDMYRISYAHSTYSEALKDAYLIAFRPSLIFPET